MTSLRPSGWSPQGNYIEVAGVAHHVVELGKVFGRVEEQFIEDMPATLIRDPRNKYDPNAVEVRIRGALAGYLPREIAAEWSARLAEAEARGLTVRANAHVWYRWAHDERKPGAWVHLWMDDWPPPLPPLG